MDYIHASACAHVGVMVFFRDVLYKTYNLCVFFWLDVFPGVVQLPSATWQLFVILHE